MLGITLVITYMVVERYRRGGPSLSMLDVLL